MRKDTEKETLAPVSLAERRNKRSAEKAEMAGWNVTETKDLMLSDVWIYSVSIKGATRALGQLAKESLEGLLAEKRNGLTKENINNAANAVRLLRTQPITPEEETRSLTQLCEYFVNTTEWSKIKSESFNIGVHLLLMDWDGHDGLGKVKLIVKPVVLVREGILSPEEVVDCADYILSYEKTENPRRLPVSLR